MPEADIALPVIRRATLADADAISAVLLQSYSQLWIEHYSVDELALLIPKTTTANARLIESGRYYVALLDARIGACGGWSEGGPEDDVVSPNTGHIRHFATLPDLLRRGLSGRILRTCIADAQRCGVTRLVCYSSLQAVAFYAAHGFSKVKQRQVPILGATLRAVEMHRVSDGERIAP